jgi:hypothetical protein
MDEANAAKVVGMLLQLPIATINALLQVRLAVGQTHVLLACMVVG